MKKRQIVQANLRHPEKFTEECHSIYINEFGNIFDEVLLCRSIKESLRNPLRVLIRKDLSYNITWCCKQSQVRNLM